MEGQEEGLVIETETPTGHCVHEANLTKEILHMTTEVTHKGVQGTLGRHDILHRSRIMVLQELPQ